MNEVLLLSPAKAALLVERLMGKVAKEQSSYQPQPQPSQVQFAEQTLEPSWV